MNKLEQDGQPTEAFWRMKTDYDRADDKDSWIAARGVLGAAFLQVLREWEHHKSQGK